MVPPLTGSVDAATQAVIHPSTTVLRSLVSDRVSQVSFAVVAGLVGIGYSVLLPFEFTQRIAWRNWEYLDARSLAFSVAFGLVTAWIVAVQIFSTRRILAVRGSTVAGAGTALGLLPSLLCCTPIVPTLLSLIGLSGASLVGTSSRTQVFFATNQYAILTLSLALVASSAFWTTRRLLRATCLTEDGCALSALDATTDETGPTHG